MKNSVFLVQIRDLLNGEFTWQGFVLLFLFGLMALIAVGLPVFVGYQVFRSKPKKEAKINFDANKKA